METSLESLVRDLVHPVAAVWPMVAGVLNVAMALLVSAHAILYKRDVRAAIGWTGLIWLAPFVGSFLYWLFGINRIQRRAERLERPGPVVRESMRVYAAGADDGDDGLQPLVELVARATGSALLSGNRVEPLVDGEQAYPAMLERIAAAERSVLLTTYIFDHDHAGRQFLDALADAHRRGVAVRVLIDGVGARYSRPRMTRLLRRAGVPVAEFLRPTVPFANPYVNLRNHRKVLVVDGRHAFTGGMNIREGCVVGKAPSPEHSMHDLHFAVDGPVVEQLFAIGAADWLFATRERLDGEPWKVAAAPAGEVEARVVAARPDERLEPIAATLLGALALARRRVCVVTPYFLPDQVLIAALRLAALRGVRVDVVLPERSNLLLVGWAAMGQIGQVLEQDCWVWLQPPPFDHSKLLVVDGVWSLIGSANWDARSLRLNFEVVVECYDRALAARLEELVERKIEASRPLRLEEVEGRPLPIRLRDGVARLAAPYL
jgi:cardiolipin synthase